MARARKSALNDTSMGVRNYANLVRLEGRRASTPPPSLGSACTGGRRPGPSQASSERGPCGCGCSTGTIGWMKGESEMGADSPRVTGDLVLGPTGCLRG